jgi:hypothetical protein
MHKSTSQSASIYIHLEEKNNATHPFPLVISPDSDNFHPTRLLQQCSRTSWNDWRTAATSYRSSRTSHGSDG